VCKLFTWGILKWLWRVNLSMQVAVNVGFTVRHSACLTQYYSHLLMLIFVVCIALAAVL